MGIHHLALLKFGNRSCLVIHMMAEEVIAAHQCEKIFPVKHDDIDGGEALHCGGSGGILEQGQFSERIASGKVVSDGLLSCPMWSFALS